MSAKKALARFHKTAAPRGTGFRLALPVAALRLNPHIAGVVGLTGLMGLTIGVIALMGDPTAGKPKLMLKLAPEVHAPDPRLAMMQQGGDDLLAGGSPALDTLGAGENVAMDGVPVIDALGGSGQQATLRPGFSQVGGPLKPGIATITMPGGAPRMPQVQTMRQTRAAPLAPAPLVGFTQPGPAGPLPAIAPDGRLPADAYARPFVEQGKPKVGLVIGGLGLNKAATKAAIERLPAEVTLSFVPYSDGLQGWIDLARANGHEVLLEVPMQPFDYPDNDPGPYTLLTDAQAEENAQRLDWLMSRATGYFGVINYLGGAFMSSEAALTPMFDVFKRRGIAFVADGQTGKGALTPAASRAGLRWGSADRVVDERPSPEAIDQQLLTLEASALQRGSALGIGFAYPVTVDQIAAWADGLPLKGYVLAPASAIIKSRR
jgi:hypothetical protein